MRPASRENRVGSNPLIPFPCSKQLFRHGQGHGTRTETTSWTAIGLNRFQILAP